MRHNNISQSTADSCLFLNKDGTDIIVITNYVDDIFITCKRKAKIEKIINYFTKYFQAKEIRQIKISIGMHISRDNDILLNQKTENLRNEKVISSQHLIIIV